MFPALEERLYKFAVSTGLVKLKMPMPIIRSIDPLKLTPKANLIYIDLKAAIKQHNKRA